MMVLTQLIAVLCFGIARGISVVERAIPRDDFVKLRPVDPNDVHEVVISIVQSNIPELQALVVEMATPGSNKFQKWMTFDDVGAMIENKSGYSAVMNWLASNSAIRVTWESKRKEYIKANAPIHVWEDLLQTKFHVWEDLSQTQYSKSKSAGKYILAEEYFLPDDIQQHISAIFNTVQVPPRFSPKYMNKNNDAAFKSLIQLRHSDRHPSRHDQASTSSPVTVSFLNSYYKVGSNTGVSQLSQSVFETSSEYFSPQDLSTFQTIYGLPAQAAVDINGFSTATCSLLSNVGNNCDEGNLDVQYIMGMSQQTVSMYWYVAGSSSSNPFVTWITDVANSPNPPLVNSMSWGSVENLQSLSVLSQFDTEASKLGAMGVTVAVSSGDNGAPNYQSPGAGCMCHVNSSSNHLTWGSPSNVWSGVGYFPSFPATSPWVTAVGATMGPEAGTAEVACQSTSGGFITTGGGFSTYYSQPTWQTSAVANYFSNVAVKPVAGFNPLGRGYPDVSLIGVNYQVVIADTLQTVFGTSCSTPVFAAMISLINAERFRNNQSSVGFLNPSLYAAAVNVSTKAMFNDVTVGNNKCCANQNPSAAVCCASGFTAAIGWDPLTGWGSVNFDLMAAVYSAAIPYSAPATPSATGVSALLIGIIVAIIIVVLAILASIVYCCFCRQSRSQAPPEWAQSSGNSLPVIATATAVQPPSGPGAVYVTNNPAVYHGANSSNQRGGGATRPAAPPKPVKTSY